MTTQPEALRLANDLEIDYHGDVVAHQAAAELRRLSAENEALRRERDANLDTINVDNAIITRLLAQRDALLEALIRCRNRFFPSDQPERDRDELWEPVNAAIKAVEENT